MAEDAEDRTEAASPRRLQRAREEGDVPISRELGLFMGLAAGLGVMALQLSWDRAGPLHWFAASLNRMRDAGSLGPSAIANPLAAAQADLLRAVLPIAAAVALCGAGTVLLQSGFALRQSVLVPDLSRISPLRGLSRIFSINTLVQFLKSLAKLAILGWLLRAALIRLMPILPGLAHVQAEALLDRLLAEAARLTAALCGAELVLVLADLFWVQRQYANRLRMTRQEQRDEAKETDGNPQVKAKRRQIRLLRARRRMMQAVRRATVVVTNPEHYAVALAYERGSRAAPMLVAKGVDEVAARIREEAYNHRVPIVANPPLARALFRLELDTEIPQEHFKAVAEIVAYVWRLQARRPVL